MPHKSRDRPRKRKQLAPKRDTTIKKAPNPALQVVGQRLLSDEEGTTAFAEAKYAQALTSESVLAAMAPTALVPLLRMRFAVHSYSEFDGIRIAFEGTTTKYAWGAWRSRVNGKPYQDYLRQQQGDAQVSSTGIDPFFPAGNIDSWGNVIFALTGLQFSSRFGGSIHITLAPLEDFGIELADKAKNVYVDLHAWLLHLYLRPSKAMFNTPTASLMSLAKNLFAEISASRYEAYQFQSNRLTPVSTDEPAIQNMLRNAALEAEGRLLTLARFALGFVHQTRLPTFNRVAEKVTRILISDGLCLFDTEEKKPFVSVVMTSSVLGPTEGIFESEAELTVTPSVWLYDTPFVLARMERKKYIGASSHTPPMFMGAIPLDVFKTVDKAETHIYWREDDPLSDDEGWAPIFEFSVAVDPAELQRRADANELGPIGPPLTALGNDPLEKWLSYGVEIRFELIKI